MAYPLLGTDTVSRFGGNGLDSVNDFSKVSFRWPIPMITKWCPCIWIGWFNSRFSAITNSSDYRKHHQSRQLTTHPLTHHWIPFPQLNSILPWSCANKNIFHSDCDTWPAAFWHGRRHHRQSHPFALIVGMDWMSNWYYSSPQYYCLLKKHLENSTK